MFDVVWTFIIILAMMILNVIQFGMVERREEKIGLLETEIDWWRTKSHHPYR